MKRFDCIVVGVGAMGSSACWHLASRGVHVLGLEQFDIPNTLGSSHGQSRLIRLAYYEHPDYVPLLFARAYDLWKEIERAGGRHIFHETGGLYMGPPKSEVVLRSAEAARRHGLKHELLDRAAIGKRYDQFNLPKNWIGLFEPRAGYLLPELAISTFTEQALRCGAEIHAREIVQSWEADARGVRVHTDRDSYRANHLIFCGGPWTGKLLKDLGLPLRVTRQVTGWVWPKKTAPFEEGRLPVWAIDSSDGGIYYGTPIDTFGLKVAHHLPGPKTDPDRVNRTATQADEKPFRAAIKRFLPDANGPLLGMRVCLYTNSPDGHFIIDRHPRHKRVSIACGFSGHGFKFASVVGEVLCDLAMGKPPTLPIGLFAISRFAN